MGITETAPEVETLRVARGGRHLTCPPLRGQPRLPKTRKEGLAAKANQERRQEIANQAHRMAIMPMESLRPRECLDILLAFRSGTEFQGQIFLWDIPTRMVCLLAYLLHFQRGPHW